MTNGSTASVHAMKVTLRDVRPAVWRRLVVPSSITLGQLHLVLQAAFGWDDDHLHAFEVRGVRYEPVLPDRLPWVFREPPRDEDRARLDRVAARAGDVVDYTYDFGDDWQHRLEVEQVGPALPDQQYPACTDGTGLAPEEDIGTPRPGRFDDRARAELNRQLRRWPGAVSGRDLPAADQPPDPAFAGLIPALTADHGECPCGCGEMMDDQAPPLPMTQPVDAVQVVELAEQAAASPMVRRGVALARWLGDGRALTPSRLLRPADAVRAVAELDLDHRILPPTLDPDAEDAATRHPWSRPKPATRPRPSEKDGEPQQATLFDDPVAVAADVQDTVSGGVPDPGTRRIRSAKDLPQLHLLWSACLAAGLIEIRANRAFPGAGLPIWDDLVDGMTGAATAEHDTQQDPDARVRVESWSLMTAGALRAREDAARTGRSHASQLRRKLMELAVPLIYTSAQQPCPVGALPWALAQLDEGTNGFGLSALYLLPMWTVEVQRLIEDWLVAGVLEPATPDPAALSALAEVADTVRAELAVHAPVSATGSPTEAEDAARDLADALLDSPAVQLTTLGRYGLARILTAHAWPVPAAGDRWDDDPEDLLDHLGRYLPNDAADELIGWIDARGEGWETALLRVIRSAGTKDEHGPARRQTLRTVLAAAGPRTPTLGTVLDAVGTDPWLEATLAMVRHEISAGPEPSTAHLLWLAVDALSTRLDDPDAFADDVADSPLTELLAEPGMLTTALTLHHPATREVLRAAAPHLDDPDLTRGLRRALTRRSGNPALRAGSGRQARNDRQYGDNRRGRPKRR